MPQKDNAEPLGPSRKIQVGSRTPDQRARKSLMTPPSEPKAESDSKDEPPQLSLDQGKSPTPNETQHQNQAGTVHGLDSLYLAEQVKYYHQKLQEQDQAYLAEINDLKQQNTRLVTQSIDPQYVIDLETQYHNVWTDNEGLRDQNDAHKIENRKLKENETSLRREINHYVQEYGPSSGATESGSPDHKTKTAELREKLSAAQDENAELYERCANLQQDLDEMKLQGGPVNTNVDKPRLVQANKDKILQEKQYISVKMDMSRLHDDLSRSIESRMLQKGTMLFETDDARAEIETLHGVIEDLKEQIRKQQDQIEELSIEMELGPGETLKSELEDAGGGSSDSSSAEESVPARSEIEKELKQTKGQLKRAKVELKQVKERHGMSNARIKKMKSFVHVFRKQLFKPKTSTSRVEQLRQSMMIQRSIENRDEMTTDDIELAQPPPPLLLEWQREEETQDEDPSNDPETMLHFLEVSFTNLYEGLGMDDEDIIWDPSMNNSPTDSSTTLQPNAVKSRTSQSTVVTKRLSDLGTNTSIKGKTLKNNSRANCITQTGKTLISTFWFRIIWAVLAGSDCWAEITIKDRAEWIKIRGPWWWSLIIQVLTFMLVSGVFVAYWCIMTASAERELWLAANEITFKKYWDTAIWGAERDLLWRLCYGLGFV